MSSSRNNNNNEKTLIVVTDRDRDGTPEVTAHTWNSQVCDRIVHSVNCLGHASLIRSARKLPHLTPDDARSVVATNPRMMLQRNIPAVERIGGRAFQLVSTGADGRGGTDFLLRRLEAIEQQCEDEIESLRRAEREKIVEIAQEERRLAADYNRYLERKQDLDVELRVFRERFVRVQPEMRDRLAAEADDLRASLMENQRDLDSAYERLQEVQMRKIDRIEQTNASNARVAELRQACERQKADTIARTRTAMRDLYGAIQVARSAERAIILHLYRTAEQDDKSDGEESGSRSGDESSSSSSDGEEESSN